MADVDVDEHKVGFENGQVRGVVEVNVEHLAIAAPVAAEVEQDALVGDRGGFEGGSKVGFGLRRVGIDFAAGRTGGSDARARTAAMASMLMVFIGRGTLQSLLLVCHKLDGRSIFQRC